LPHYRPNPSIRWVAIPFTRRCSIRQRGNVPGPSRTIWDAAEQIEKLVGGEFQRRRGPELAGHAPDAGVLTGEFGTLLLIPLHGSGYRISARWSRSVHFCGITLSFASVSASLHRTLKMAESVNIVDAIILDGGVAALFVEA
jgi:hypothetical protein